MRCIYDTDLYSLAQISMAGGYDLEIKNKCSIYRKTQNRYTSGPDWWLVVEC